MILDIKGLKVFKPGDYFRSGYFIQHGEKMRWVAVKGYINDWAIYFYIMGKPDSWIHDYGNKLYDRDMIKKLVPCTDDVLKNYRR